jgi:hypothetical protein
MMNILAPSNMVILQKVVMLILTFEIIPGELYQENIWKWTEEEDLTSRLEAVGLDSRIFMLSMGMPFYIFTVCLMLLFIALAINCCTKAT